MKAEFDERSHNHDERAFDRHGSAREGDVKILEHDEESEKIHLCDEMAGEAMTETNGTVLSLLANGSGAI